MILIFFLLLLCRRPLCRQILVLEGGRVAERGTNGELMEKGGVSAEMYRLQAEKYGGEEWPSSSESK